MRRRQCVGLWWGIARRQEIVQGVEGVEEGGRGRRGHDPFCGCVVEVVEYDVDADHGALPAEAVDEVCGHLGGGVFAWRSWIVGTGVRRVGGGVKVLWGLE